ncbi:MAG TPA: S8 family serine peptidase [Solirubrobacteraceae bacterium]|nr:S8 family serine peptidase [Solirubrobacteraceae bacterium]
MPVRTLPLALAILLVLLPQGAAAATGTGIIVKRDAGLTAAERADIRADADVRFVESLPLPRTELVAAAPGDVRDALRDLKQDPDVVYAELDRPIRALAPSNDPNFNDLWALENRGDFSFTSGRPPESVPAVPDADMDVVEAWAISTGAGTTVGVLDTGVDATHPDLAPNMEPGWDFVSNHANQTDDDGHGTHVAGTLAAVKDNAVGGVGVAPNARIVPLKVLGADGTGTVSDLIEAYDYAGDHGIKVVNASLGGIGAVQAERAAINANPNTLFVVAAGNGGDDEVGDDNDDVDDETSEGANYPCAYNLPNILCVGASTHTDEPAEFSNFGTTTVDVFAPGYRIRSTWLGGLHATLNGTSMATPHVTGTAALLLSQNPALTPTAIRQAVVAFADDKASLTDLSVSDGRANTEATLLQIDGDADGVPDRTDTCPGTPNPTQGTENCPVSDDPDRDSWPTSIDLCPSVPGTARGCPDADGDGVMDSADNCPTVSNPGQQNSDGRSDGGNACDSDTDNDGRPNDSDACPTVPALTANGCPVVPPPNGDGDGFIDAQDACPFEAAFTANGCPVPALTALSGKVTKRGTLRWVTVRARTTRAATLRILVQRKSGRRWVKVKRRTLATTANRVRLKVSRLRRGRHRVVVAVYSSAGVGTPATRYFTVR